jgi:hypothetical protein
MLELENKMIRINNDTTELSELKKGKPFTWGKIVKFHEYGIYTIGEYIESDKFSKDGVRETLFHIWVNGKSTSHSSSSLESAIIDAISYEHDGANSQAGYFFKKMIGLS